LASSDSDSLLTNFHVGFAAANIAVSKQPRARKLVEIIVPSIVALLLLLAGLFFCAMRAKKHVRATRTPLHTGASSPFGRRNQIAAASTDDTQDSSLHPPGQGNHQDLDLPSFDVATILAATDSFSIDNKIGQGGFGPVYMVITFSLV
jgi:hypothetical protein